MTTSNKKEDYDGHRDFLSLTAEQKLLWLSQAVIFIKEFGGKAKNSKSVKNKS